jgi:hypothetical protein
MNEVDQSASGTPDKTSGQAENQEIKKEDKVSYESYKKLLDEKKKQDLKLRDFEEKLEKERIEKLEKEGNLKSALDEYKKKAEDKDQLLERERATYQMEKISNTVKTLALKSGAHNPDDILKVFKDDFKDKKLSEINEDLIKGVVEKAKKERPYWFMRDVKIDNVTPANPNFKDLNSESLKKMSAKEIAEQYKKMRNK